MSAELLGKLGLGEKRVMILPKALVRSWFAAPVYIGKTTSN
jgi:hypothetical protein